MERILIFSDTHGNTDNAFRVIDSIIGVTGIIHLGDCIRDAERIENSVYPILVYSVSGNNDFAYGIPSEKLIEICGKRIFMTHGHMYISAKGIDRLKETAFIKKADIVLFGHTHKPYYEKENSIIFANPGSISRPRYSEASYGVLEIENGKIGYSNIIIWKNYKIYLNFYHMYDIIRNK